MQCILMDAVVKTWSGLSNSNSEFDNSNSHLQVAIQHSLVEGDEKRMAALEPFLLL